MSTWMACLLLDTKEAVNVMKAKEEMTEGDQAAEARLNTRLDKALADIEALTKPSWWWPT